MEELLNKLIEKGWKPFDVDVKIKRAKYGYSVHFLCRPLVNFVLDGYAEATIPLRELVSKESWLWQFVCENRMVNKVDNDRRYFDELNDICYDKTFHDDECQYWIIESALCDEDKLEQFLLKNIKVE